MGSVLDIFNNDAFTTVNMSIAIDKVETAPRRLGQQKLFTPNPIREIIVGVEMRESGLSLIKTTKRGETLAQATQGKRKKLHFATSRVGKEDKVLASELAFLVQFGTADQIVQVQAEIARRMSGPGGLLDDIETTHEHMRLSALNGTLLDADKSVIYNFYDEFGINENPEIAFDLANTTDGALEETVNARVLRPRRRKSKGARYSEVRDECSSQYFDELIKTKEVRERRKTDRENGLDNDSYQGRVVQFAGITWQEYVGTDDGTVAVEENKVKFYPGGVGNTVFQHVMSPGEAFEHQGMIGQNIYAEINLEVRNSPRWALLEAISYPLFINTRPEMIFKGHLGA